MESIVMKSEPCGPLLPLPATEIRQLGTFWQPNLAFITELANYLAGRKVLEIFGGNGLLAGYLASKGVAVTCTSILSSMDCHSSGVYHPITQMRAIGAVHALGNNHDVLLMCWPTVTMEVLACARAWGTGRNIVFAGEMTDYTLGPMGMGGCATDEFFEATEIVRAFSAYQPRNMLDKAVVLRLKEYRAPAAEESA
jgi:hypothetical protein